jgi:NADH-quinone oxidoreductase subunit G
MTISTAFDGPVAESPCVGCGQCAAVCPTGAIGVKNDVRKVWKVLDDPSTKVSAQIAPAVRVAQGDRKEFGLADGEMRSGKSLPRSPNGL